MIYQIDKGDLDGEVVLKVKNKNHIFHLEKYNLFKDK